ncbi:MAG: hypothetical protein J0H43_04510, partial [Actinobacteria bacterium]|nr:hypothetical protein [Actinomycetota bacterium]
FTPEKAADIRASVIALTRAHCLSVAEQLVTGSADLRTVAYPAPPAIMSELIGLPLSDLRLLKRWTQNSLELYWGWPDPARQFELATSASEFYCWLRNQIASAAGDDSLFVESGWCPLLSFRAPRTAEVTWS